MAEPCDPEVLHARVSVLENNDTRHEKEIRELWKETTDLKLCAQCLPGISSSLVEIKKTVDFLNSCKITDEGIEKGKRGVWEDNRWWIERIILVVAGAIAYVVWAHLQELRL